MYYVVFGTQQGHSLIGIKEPYTNVPNSAQPIFDVDLGTVVGLIDWGDDSADLPLPSPVVGPNGVLIQATLNGALQARDPLTGAMIDQLTPTGLFRTVGTPALASNGMLYWAVANCQAAGNLCSAYSTDAARQPNGVELRILNVNSLVNGTLGEGSFSQPLDVFTNAGKIITAPIICDDESLFFTVNNQVYKYQP